MLTHEDLFEMLYGERATRRSKQRATEEIAKLSNEDWNDWLVYRLWRKVPPLGGGQLGKA